MGGRGASSASGKYKINHNGEVIEIEYGEEYYSIGKFMTSRGEVKVVKSLLSSNTKLPLETKTKGRIYVTTNKDGNIKSVGFYGDDGIKRESWDVGYSNGDHRHAKGITTRKNGTSRHKHIGKTHADGGTIPLTKQDKKFVRELNSKWAREQRRAGKKRSRSPQQ